MGGPPYDTWRCRTTVVSYDVTGVRGESREKSAETRRTTVETRGAGAPRSPHPGARAVFYIYRYARFERIKQLAQKNQKW